MPELLNWLDDSEIRMLHNEALNIIEEVGIKLDNSTLLNKLKSFDTTIDMSNKQMKIPRDIVTHFLSKVPDNVTLYAIDSKYDLELGKQTYFRPISGTIGIIENRMDVRKPTVQDMCTISKLVQGLESMHFNATSVIPFDVPENMRAVASARACFENCSKHVLVDALNKRDLEIILEMAFAISGGENEFMERPFMQVHFPAISPLIWDENACDSVLVATEYQIPMRVGSSPMSGANSPIKLAGTLLLMHAEAIAAVAVTQMLREGCPVYYGAAPTLFDMRFGTMSWGAAEHAKMASCSAALAHSCNLFVTSTGFATDGKTPDQQVAIEKSMNLLLAALSGIDVLAGAGLFEGELCYDPVQLIIDNEIARYVENVLKGVQIDREQMCSDLIKEVGIGGQYLDTEQTLQFFRTEHQESTLLDRRSRGVWNGIEEKDIYDKAAKMMDDIIAEQSDHQLSDKVRGQIDDIYRKNQ
ncbi:MAG: trimethylamine methyltransferase family protein [Spirochaetota bacterium]|nr:MAG: trimethylamine methyltransferase family protein [Spirochaetota bacterium]